MCRVLVLITFFILINHSIQDIYLHNPRGSNNRLNEKSAQRTNNNRLFDSQNNGRGGYNVGDATNQPFATETDQYQMRYFQSGQQGASYLTLEWTEQHGCGGNENTDPTKQNCALVLQYMCQTKTDYDENNLDRVRDGLNTNTQDYTAINTNDQETAAQIDARKQNNVKLDRGLQEPWQWYDSCYNRERNKGLFTADQSLRNNARGYSSAIFTRQNPNGNRNGYECPEERDYFPYWHPSAWKDIAVLTSNSSLCDYYKSESFNVKPKYQCIETYVDSTRIKSSTRWNNQDECSKNGGKWTELWNYLEKAPQFRDEATCQSQRAANLRFKWAIPYDSININNKECLVLLDAPACQQAEWTRSNHLGNAKSSSNPSRFDWKLPYFPSKRIQKCVFRIRYNITTDDYDSFQTDSKSNGINSPVQNNPQIIMGANNQVLKLALNTAQYGRVFQDRSHSFYLLPRSSDLGDAVNIYNLNIRGKRGNIVQVYPAVEYDFIPNSLSLRTSDILHIQWTGSNTHNNGQPQGDGQAGDDGQGQTGTDRNNFVQINNLNENFPLRYEMANLWNDVDLIGFLNDINYGDDSTAYLQTKNSFRSNDISKDIALYFSTSGYYQCKSTSTCAAKSFETLSQNANNSLDPDLNKSPASITGALIRFKTSNKKYFYMSSRNNNFSNRSQKGTIIIL